MTCGNQGMCEKNINPNNVFQFNSYRQAFAQQKLSCRSFAGGHISGGP